MTHSALTIRSAIRQGRVGVASQNQGGEEQEWEVPGGAWETFGLMGSNIGQPWVNIVTMYTHMREVIKES
jgi:hypothetical protein